MREWLVILLLVIVVAILFALFFANEIWSY
ncbi:Uncharacterised protein [Serratia grimesii]|nr:Uncharacterised protein [Serratia grimesii]